MRKVVYLTGAPATGKSTLGQALSRRISNLKVFSYSQELRSHVTSVGPITESDLRRESSRIVTPEHVAAVDTKLAHLVARERKVSSIVIDSHAVTKEDYGFRITPFSSRTLEEIAPDAIVCLYAAPEVVTGRIALNAAGRPSISLDEASMHCQLQNAVAAQYSVILGKPCYLIDSGVDEDELLNKVITCLKLT
ncbi:ATP-binding protein [Polaromonas sp. YR568]|uniref:ATP-binding protein n=1 Tax=Polaromonas sp. YR568 TaxID=1855301 RepID=UPI0031383296